MHFIPIRRTIVMSLLATVWLVAGAAARADDVQAKSEPQQQYMRVETGDQDEPVALQTAVVSYTGMNDKGQPVVVDLVGVVHIGDKSYYQELNKLFESYDAVLYELVAPEGTKIPKGGGKKRIRHPLTAMQRMMQSVLELDFQLDQIDYTKENLIHADMTPDEFAQSMKDRDESFLKLFFRMMGQSAAMQNQAESVSDAEMFAALFAKDRALRMKRLMARQFEQMEAMMVGFNGPDGSTIITERNKKALSVLSRELDAGKKRVAIFYGAGHLSDMDQRMQADFGMSRGKTIWLTAWKMQEKKAGKGEADSEAKDSEAASKQD